MNSFICLLVCSCAIGQLIYNATVVVLVDINECLEKIHSCRLGAICINKEGSYTCPCRDGFQYDRNTAQCLNSGLYMHAVEPQVPSLFVLI